MTGDSKPLARRCFSAPETPRAHRWPKPFCGSSRRTGIEVFSAGSAPAAAGPSAGEGNTGTAVWNRRVGSGAEVDGSFSRRALRLRDQRSAIAPRKSVPVFPRRSLNGSTGASRIRPRSRTKTPGAARSPRWRTALPGACPGLDVRCRRFSVESTPLNPRQAQPEGSVAATSAATAASHKSPPFYIR